MQAGHKVVASRRRSQCGKDMASDETDGRWPTPACTPAEWDDRELALPPPSGEMCFASLLHGDDPTYFVYALVLGWRLAQSLASASADVATDCVLLCGPGRWTQDPDSRRALACTGWSRLVPVEPIEAEHLDKSWTKRHGIVFTKLRVLQLPYRRVLLLDLDLLPRVGVDLTELFKVGAPAAKYHGPGFEGPWPLHGAMLPSRLVSDQVWCPNAGVMRLDPRPTSEARSAQLDDIIADVVKRRGESYLPEQYYLAEKLSHWRHISHFWNWEVCPEWDDPGILQPLEHACQEAKWNGWAGMRQGKSAADILDSVRVWHFSGNGDTVPWRFMHCGNAVETRDLASRLFASRDPGMVVTTALCEWRDALDKLLLDHAPGQGILLAEVVRQLACQSVHAMTALGYWCHDHCHHRFHRHHRHHRHHLRELPGCDYARA